MGCSQQPGDMSALQGGNLWTKQRTLSSLAVRCSWLHCKSLLPVLGQVTLLVTQYPSCKAGIAAYLMGCCEGGLMDAFAVWCINWGGVVGRGREQQKARRQTSLTTFSECNHVPNDNIMTTYSSLRCSPSVALVGTVFWLHFFLVRVLKM